MASDYRGDWIMRIGWTFGLVGGVRLALFDLEQGQAIWRDLQPAMLIVGLVLWAVWIVVTLFRRRVIRFAARWRLMWDVLTVFNLLSDEQQEAELVIIRRQVKAKHPTKGAEHGNH